MEKPIIHVCVLDDDQDTLELTREEFNIRQIFSLAKVEFFTSPKKFIEKLPEMNIGILDQNLGQATSGFDIVEEIYKHNKERISIAKIKVILMSGKSDINVPIYYLNQQKARFFVNKNRGNFYKILSDFTHIAIEEVMDDIDYETRHNQRKERASKLEETVINSLMSNE